MVRQRMFHKSTFYQITRPNINEQLWFWQTVRQYKKKTPLTAIETHFLGKLGENYIFTQCTFFTGLLQTSVITRWHKTKRHDVCWKLYFNRNPHVNENGKHWFDSQYSWRHVVYIYVNIYNHLHTKCCWVLLHNKRDIQMEACTLGGWIMCLKAPLVSVRHSSLLDVSHEGLIRSKDKGPK